MLAFAFALSTFVLADFVALGGFFAAFAFLLLPCFCPAGLSLLSSASSAAPSFTAFSAFAFAVFVDLAGFFRGLFAAFFALGAGFSDAGTACVFSALPMRPVRLLARHWKRLVRYGHHSGYFHQMDDDAGANGAAFLPHHLRSHQKRLHFQLCQPVHLMLACYPHLARCPQLPDFHLAGYLPRRHVFSGGAHHACLCAVS